MKIHIPSVPANFMRSIDSYSPVKPITEVVQSSFAIKPKVKVIENNKAFHVPTLRSHREKDRSVLLGENDQNKENSQPSDRMNRVRYLGTIPSQQKYKAS